MDEYLLLESETLRRRLCTEKNTSILNHVGKLVSLTEKGWTTLEYIAKFYQVPVPTIKSIILRHKNEIIVDGYKILQSKDLTVKNLQKFEHVLGEDIKKIKKLTDAKTRSIALLSRRAALRIGMLLRDSEVARNMRSYLLNSEKKLDQQQSVGNENLLKMAGQLSQHANQLAQNAEQLIYQANLVTAVVNELQQTKESVKKITSFVSGQEDRIQQLENMVYSSLKNPQTPNQTTKSKNSIKNSKTKMQFISEKQVKVLKNEMSKTGKHAVSVWKKFNKNFAIRSYSELPVELFEDALQWFSENYFN